MKQTYSSKFKSKVALEVIQGGSTIAEFAGKYQVHVNQVQQWKKRVLENASDIFLNSPSLQLFLCKKIVFLFKTGFDFLKHSLYHKLYRRIV